MKLCCRVALVLILLCAAPGLFAEDLTGADRLLCTSHQAFECEAGESCDDVSLEDLNLPPFILVDLDKKTLSSTEASGQNRSTEMSNLQFFDPLIVIQTAQQGRGMTWVIHEPTGKATMTVAIHHEAYVFFGSCTPLPAK